jgi:hypothetical protein
MASSKNDSLYIEEIKELKQPPLVDFSVPTEELHRESDCELPFLTTLTIDEMVAGISRLYTHYHRWSLAMPNPKVVKAALTKFRKDNPTWSSYRVWQSIRNIYDSTEPYVNKAKSPDVWIKRLPEFSVGPLGEFGRVLNRQPDFDGDLEHLPSETAFERDTEAL